MNVLLDTNVVIYYFQGKEPYQNRVIEWVATGQAAISVVTVAEVLAKASRKEARLFEQLVTVVTMEPINFEIARKAADLRHRIIGRKNRVTLLDCFIAATALVGNYQLATADRKGFPFRELTLVSF